MDLIPLGLDLELPLKLRLFVASFPKARKKAGPCITTYYIYIYISADPFSSEGEAHGKGGYSTSPRLVGK